MWFVCSSVTTFELNWVQGSCLRIVLEVAMDVCITRLCMVSIEGGWFVSLVGGLVQKYDVKQKDIRKFLDGHNGYL